MSTMRYVLFQKAGSVEFVEVPASHAYQLTALNKRLHKELLKLTAAELPELPVVIAECENLEIVGEKSLSIVVHNGLDYMNRLEQAFSSIPESNYPLISLLTEIRALQAQLEQWYEEERA